MRNKIFAIHLRAFVIFWILNIMRPVYAQEVRKYQPLKILDDVPNVALNVYQGNKVTQGKLGDLKGKLVILEFSGVNCGSCIMDLPNLDRLFSEFKSQVEIIVVTKDSKNDFDKLWAQFSKFPEIDPQLALSGKHLKFIYSDTVLSQLFPHSGLPCAVWIDKNGKYRVFVRSTSNTSANITSFIKTGKANFYHYYNYAVSQEGLKSWLSESHKKISSLSFYSMLKPFDSTLEANGTIVQNINEISKHLDGVTFLNCSLIEMYKWAYFKNHKNIYVFVDPKDSSIYTTMQRNFEDFTWREKNTYCFDYKQSNNSSNNLETALVQELDGIFNVKSSLEDRPVKCLVFKQITSDTNKFAYKSSKSKEEWTVKLNKSGEKLLVIDSLNLEVLRSAIAEDYLGRYNTPSELLYLPCIDETKFKGLINIKIPWGKDNYSLDALNAYLKPLGLSFAIEIRNQKVLILK